MLRKPVKSYTCMYIGTIIMNIMSEMDRDKLKFNIQSKGIKRYKIII